ncbi:MAG: hypothetical protein CVU69_08315 [Deltaproteobacteria bacterium HGW-Deltaproteobacteria-4]|nr:MAG: hypothetical protein CVU69_08315 [Deltaproteobacteria bacterium HGW-Deltaproteobacteria-4]
MTPSSYGWYQNLWIRLFNTTTAQWTGPFNLNYSNLGGPAGDYYSNSFEPQIAMNAAGSAVVVWKRTTGFYDSGSPYYEPPALKAMVYDNNGLTPAWKALARLDNESILPAKAKTVIDAQGNVVVVWLQEVGAVNNLYYSRLAAGAETWSAAASLENSDTQIRDFDMTVDGTGNVLVVWDQEVDSIPRFFFSLFDVDSSSWSVPVSEMIASGRLVVGMDEDGNAVAVWRMPKSGGGDGVYASRYNPAAANVFWSSPERLDTLPGTTGDPVLAVNAAGNTFVSWIQSDGTTDSVFASYLK